MKAFMADEHGPRDAGREPMTVLEAIYGRRAVRSYEVDRVDKSAVEILLRAAVRAPSAMNHQPWIFAVVQSRDTLERLSNEAKKLLLSHERDSKTTAYIDRLRAPRFNVFYDAGTLIVVGVSKRTWGSEADAWLAAGNILHAARDLGLGTYCIGLAVDVLNTASVKDELGIPEAGAAIAPIIVGVPRGDTLGVSRDEPRVVAWIR